MALTARTRWSDDEIERAQEMRSRGLSFTQISRKLKTRSRCAVAGLSHRGRL